MNQKHEIFIKVNSLDPALSIRSYVLPALRLKPAFLRYRQIKFFSYPYKLTLVLNQDSEIATLREDAI
jgi:hypothetical protein